jgi:LuxR family maltose regulon positive regulatory protein
MKELLRRACSEGVERDYASKLLVGFEVEVPKRESAAVASHEGRATLSEPLSDRELEVLRWLNTDLSGPEIAQELNIAVSTLRTHTRNIYNKLGVGNRRMAVSRATELKLL